MEQIQEIVAETRVIEGMEIATEATSKVAEETKINTEEMHLIIVEHSEEEINHREL